MIAKLWATINLGQAIAVAAMVGGSSYVVAHNFELIWNMLAKVSADTYVMLGVAVFGSSASVVLGKLFHSQPVRGKSLRPPAPIDGETTKPDRPV